MTEAPTPPEDERPWHEWIAILCSWTFALADRRKRGLRDAARTHVIARMNAFYLVVSTVLAAAVIAASGNETAAVRTVVEGAGPLPILVGFAVGSYCLSRCIEVFYAFYRDAFAKLDGERSKSDLNGRRRIRLALASYVELIIDFGILCSLVPAEAWPRKGLDGPTRVTDAIFYSASTITTSGGGGFVPKGAFLQALTVFEIACGLILLVVCFAVYAARPSD